MTLSRPFVLSVPNEELRADLELGDDVDVVVWDMTTPAPRAQFDIVVLPYADMSAVLPLLADVKVTLVQGQQIGYENVIAHLPEGLRFANGASVHETSTAELAVALTLAAQRRIPEFVTAKNNQRWAPQMSSSLADRRVCLLGFGGVGKAIARRLSGFEVHISAVASRARTEDGIEVRAFSDMAAVLPSTDVLIVSLPNTPETRHIIDDTVLSALPEGALVVNIGRGPLVDTDALVSHVSRGRIRAALDVTDPEPLPTGHPLWDLDNVLLSPHVGGASDAMRPRIAKLVTTQVRRALSGDAPLNVVLNG